VATFAGRYWVRGQLNGAGSRWHLDLREVAGTHLCTIRSLCLCPEHVGVVSLGGDVWPCCGRGCADNFEWEDGYRYRFGLHHVEYNNSLNRIPKASASWCAHTTTCSSLPTSGSLCQSAQSTCTDVRKFESLFPQSTGRYSALASTGEIPGPGSVL
jgi:hypothetical protein